MLFERQRFESINIHNHMHVLGKHIRLSDDSTSS